MFFNSKKEPGARCLKITETVSFNIASEAKKMVNFAEVFLKHEACGHIVVPDRSV